MTRTYYKGAAGCLVVYDITNRRSFEQAKEWKQDLDQKIILPNCELVPCILVANKASLPWKIYSQFSEAHVCNFKLCDSNLVGGGGWGVYLQCIYEGKHW